MQERDPENPAEPRGSSSFCIPKAALAALIENKANAYEICAYLTLARYTDATGRLSPASVKAVNTATGGNKATIERAIARLQTMRVHRHGPQIGKKPASVIDCGPIVWSRDAWTNETGEILADGPIERAKIRYVLPDFDEPLEERVWFSAGLVSGINGFLPLKELKNAGDIAARLLLLLYQSNDMEGWGGIEPHKGPYKRYEPVADDVHLAGDVRLIRAKMAGPVASGGHNSIFALAWGEKHDKWWDKHEEAGGPCWRALDALQSSGLIYEMVMVLNRDAKKQHFAGGGEYSAIPQEAEPYYELDCRSRHGYKPAGEEGIGSATARTAGDCGCPVATEGGHLDGTYAAIVPRGYGAMIAGIFRLRFRVANPKNVGVKDAWARIGNNNRTAFELVQRVRRANKLDLLTAAWGAERKTTKTIVEPETSPALEA
ncbi:hypothetical protein P5X00_39735 (plasmid) [Paraburkholderia sp. A2RO-4L]|uniref:hypothetical protein n=1 Tax=Paraburkholderia sp. A2RO-4L TaxID=3028374 RepID=UPI003DA9BF89